MRILSIALVLGLLGAVPATASAAHARRHHARSASHGRHAHAKAKSKKSSQHASSNDRALMQPKRS